MAQQRKDPPRRNQASVVSSAKGSKKGFYVMIGAVALAGILVLAYMSGRTKTALPIALDPNLPKVSSQGYVMGSATAPLEVTEFGDFECPGCNRFAEITEPDVRARLVNTGKIRFRFIDYPLVSIHKNTLNASVAAACANEQGRFWELHDMLYANQETWNGEATSDPDKVIKGLAHAVPGVDVAKFDRCLDGRQTLAKVQSHMKIAEDMKLPGTPTFIVGGNRYGIELTSIDEFTRVVNQAIAAAADSAKAAAKPPAKPKKP